MKWKVVYPVGLYCEQYNPVGYWMDERVWRWILWFALGCDWQLFGCTPSHRNSSNWMGLVNLSIPRKIEKKICRFKTHYVGYTNLITRKNLPNTYNDNSLVTMLLLNINSSRGFWAFLMASLSTALCNSSKLWSVTRNTKLIIPILK